MNVGSVTYIQVIFSDVEETVLDLREISIAFCKQDTVFRPK